VYTLNEVRRYRETRGKKKLILDTNLLLLLFIGGCDKKFLPSCQCTEKYTEDDYNLLLKVLNFFEPEIVITPHILAEFSNISRRDIKEPKIHYYLMMVMDKLQHYKEEHIPLDRLLGLGINVIVLFGFPDMSIIEAAKKLGGVILTDEISLGLYANSNQIPNVSFSAVRANQLITSAH
jgi:hypothetical protein